jgi:hypothetical protein
MGASDSATSTVIPTGEFEIEASYIVQDGGFRATVLLRSLRADANVREVGYVFAKRYPDEASAMIDAEQFALIASINPSRHLTTADGEFSLQWQTDFSLVQRSPVPGVRP